jgi:hypothetical protein
VCRLARVERDLRQHLGLGWARLRDDVLGDAVVLAYRPGPPGKQEQEQGLLLLRARDARVLADLVDRLNQVQTRSGELTGVEEREHNGIRYYRRAERKGPTFYYLQGPVLAFSSQEEALRQVIDREQAAPTSGEPVVAERLRQLGADRALLALWLNPRAFDAELAAKVARAERASAPVLKTFTTYWKALDGAALFANLGKDLSLSLAVRARTEQLPAPARRLLECASRPSDLWPAFPKEALLAVSGRLDLAALFELLGSFLPPKDRASLEGQLDRTVGAALGKDVVKEVLPALGPDWGLCLVAPRPEDRDWLPQGVLALRVAAGDPEVPVDQALLSALHSWAQFLVVVHNHQHPDRTMFLLTEPGGARPVRYLSSPRGLPPGLRPAFALYNGYLVLATSPAVLRRLIPAGPPSRPAPGGPVPLLRVSFKNWRSYLAARREEVVGAMAQKEQLPRTEASRRLDGLLNGLELLDRLELRQRSAPGQATWTLVLRAAQPFKK